MGKRQASRARASLAHFLEEVSKISITYDYTHVRRTDRQSKKMSEKEKAGEYLRGQEELK